MFTDLFDEWQQPQTVILTPNQRTARVMQQRFDFAQQQQGKCVWPTLEIYPFTTWATLLWQQLGNQPQLLNSVQWQQLWEQVISAKHPELLSMKATAIAAWTLCHEYLIDIHPAAFSYNDDTQLWFSWAKQIQQHLQDERWIDNSQLLIQLLQAKWELPAQLYVVNFIEFTSAQRRFLDWLATQGVNIIYKELACEHNQVIKFISSDQRDDLTNMVKWAITAAETKQTIACVVPELSIKKDQIDYLFKAYLEDTTLYTISLGKSLLEYPMIKKALNVLDLPDKTQSAAAWVNDIQQQLKQFHWPCERALTSEEYQLLEAWHVLLENFVSLSLIQKTFSFVETKTRLTEIAKHTIFQVKASSHTKIHVLGILEAAGLTFDAVWIANMHERVWPPAASANPFLPRPLQQKFQLPHVSSARDFTFYQRVTLQLQQAAPLVIFSYPMHDGENPLRESPFIRQLTVHSLHVPAHFSKAEKLLGKSVMEVVDDDQGPLVDIASLQHRGSQIFKDQAACPFRAYAKHRLGAAGLELPQLGFRAMQRGQIIHAVLEKVWRELRSHEKLCQLSELSLRELLEKSIDDVLKIAAGDVADFFIALEKQRLQQLLIQWLHQEKHRKSFVVIATEEKFEVDFAGFPLKLRVDRIDQIAENQYLILDYKTSVCSTNDWFGDRLDEPQLPLYCVISALPVSSIAFAQIRANEMKFKESECTNEYKKDWEVQLKILATEFLQGHAKVQPKYGEQTCRYCDLSALCRVRGD